MDVSKINTVAIVEPALGLNVSKLQSFVITEPALGVSTSKLMVYAIVGPKEVVKQTPWVNFIGTD